MSTIRGGRAVLGALLLGILGCGAALAQEPIAPEELTVEQSIAPGPNVYAVTPNWGGVGAVYIFSAEDLSFKGAMTTGLVAQFTMAGGVGYATSAFPRRIISGPVEAVLQSFSFPDLAMTREIIIPSTMAQTAAFQGALQVSADGAFAFVQNATPATSVTIVNLRTGEVAGEAPTPGCWAINLAPSGRKFTMLCGDGTLLSVKIDETGAPAGQFHSAQIFDAQADPLFIHSQRAGGDLLFVSYGGVLYRVSDADDTPRLVSTYDFTEGTQGDWAPGGYGVMAYSSANQVLFVLMHAGAFDGSHKNGAEEIWAVDLRRRAVLYRSNAEGETHIAVTQDRAAPILFTSNSHEGGLSRYEVDPAARFAARRTNHVDLASAGYVVAP